MNMEMNAVAVLVAAFSGFMLGGLWYSPLMFGRLWEKENRFAELKGNVLPIFAISFLFAVVSAGAFAIWLGPAPGMNHALVQGLFVGALFVAPSYGVNYQFSRRSWLLWGIDGGYHVVQFVIYGVVFSLLG